MAELHVERKQSNIWPWVFGGLILLALIIWLGMRAVDTPETTGLTDSAVVVTPDAMAIDQDTPAAVTAFLQYVDSQVEATDAGVAHEYTSTGMQRLVTAFDAVVERDTLSSVEVAPLLAEMRALTDSIQMNSQSMDHAHYAREAFVIAARLMEAKQQAGGTPPPSAVADMRSTAESIQPTVPLLDQIASVRRFFAQTATAFRAMTKV